MAETPAQAHPCGQPPLPSGRAAAASPLLVSWAQQGDEDAFAALIRRYQDRAYLIALRLTGRPEDAQDALQEALLSAWRGLGGFRADADFGTWLTRIVINSCHRQRRDRRPVESLDDSTASPAGPPVESIVEGRFRRLAVQRAIAGLSFDQRTAFVLHVFAGHSYLEVADVLGISPSAAKVRVHRARRTIASKPQAWAGS